MSKQHDRSTRISTIVLLFTLMVSVFAFGLNARIQSFSKGASLTPAKLFIKKISSEEVVMKTAEAEPSVPLGLLHALLKVVATSFPSHDALRSRQIEWGLWMVSILEARGPSLMLRPPPFQI